MARIRLQEVTKIFFGGVRAVHNMTLDVADHECVVLCGPTGCGKTTTLRLIAGLESATSGHIRFDEQIVDRVSPKDRDVAMVFQHHSMYPHLNVRENLAFPLRMRRGSRADIDRRVDEVAERLGLNGLLDRDAEALSGGERQRVAIGRALVRRPKCILLDEPLNHLDVRSRLRTRALLKQLHQEYRMTMLYVTHDQEEALALADRLVVMADGAIQQLDSPWAIYRRPANRLVAESISMPPLNFLTATVQPSTTGLCLAGDGWTLPVTAEQHALLAGRGGGSVVVGIRPQSWHRAPGELATGTISETPLPHGAGFRDAPLACHATWEAIIDQIIFLGECVDVSFLVGPAAARQELVARLGAATLSGLGTLGPGVRIKLGLNLNELLFFEPGPKGANLQAGLGDHAVSGYT